MNKKLLIVATSILFQQFVSAQTLFTYGKKKVEKAEFLKAYNKNPNPNDSSDRKKALQEYLDLYINYKLKVQSAYDAKLEEQPTFKYESNNFKKQIAENYINNEANINELIKEAFNRSQKDIKVAQVFIEFKPGQEMIEATSQINKAYAALKQGKDFGEVAAEFSNDESTKQTKGNLGYITAFTLPYEFENEIYKLKQGEFSTPYKSAIGWHIFKNVSERAALGKRRVAQVLITFPKDGADDVKKAAAIKADTVYNMAKRGISFDKLVAEFSNDKASAGRNGEMSEISVGQYSPDFEDHAYALQHVGDYSKPFLTQHGWHILKLLEISPVGKNFDDPVTSANVRQQVERADRLNIAKKTLVSKWMSKCGYKAGLFDEKEFLQFTDSAIKAGSLNSFKKVTPATVLFSFTKQKITAGDWAKFILATKQSGSNLSNKPTLTILKEYEKIVCGEYYREHLEDFNPDLKAQSKEFDEANLLFSAMDKNVWAKANEDTTGLRNYYNQQKQKYTWQPGISAIVVTANDEEKAKEVADSLKANSSNWRFHVSNYGNAVLADSSRFENNQLPITQKIDNKVGFISKPEKNNNDGSFTFIYITAVHNKVETRNFDDARGLVTNDYQQVLEQKWLSDLKKQYPVIINKEVWKTVK